MSELTALVSKNKGAVSVRKGEGEQMSVLGCGVRFLCHAKQTGEAWSLMETEIPKDAGPPPHHHPWDEAYYVVEGEVSFEFGGRSELVKPGDFIYAPAGTLHAFHGVSDRPARMLIFDAPAHAEDFFKEVEREVTELPRDLPKVPEIGKRHQLYFVIPG
jgi:quercetin dioxygenase-like cupin family protein